MQRSNQYTIESRIRFSEIDHTEQITLPGIVNYFQDCSIFQSEDIGFGIEYLKGQKRAWVQSSWQVVADRYPRLGEKIRVSTWASGFKGMLGSRNFCMEDETGMRVAYANSLWVYMDVEKGRPAKPSEEEIQAYGTGEALEMEYASRKITLPEKMERLPEFPVRRCHIDTNEHVNNCQYVQMAIEAADEDRRIRQLRAEYKRSAVCGDLIVPELGREDGRTVVKLCDREDKPYAVIEFMWDGGIVID